MSTMRKRWLGNSLANLIGGLGSAGLNVLLPAVVVHHLSADQFSTWNLALQVSIYVNLLSLGLQTATARAIAHAADANGGDPGRLPQVVRAARSIAHGASAVALAAVLALVAVYPMLFPRIAPALLGEFRVALGVLGLAAVLQILAQVEMGTFQGLHRNAVFIGVQLSVRLLTVLIVWLGVRADGSLMALAGLMAAASALLWPSMRLVFRQLVPWARSVSAAAVDRAVRKELLGYCGALSVWSVSMLLVNSVGVIIVGRIDFSMTGPYAISMTAAGIVGGLLGAALGPLLTMAASLHASEATRTRLPALLYRSTAIVATGLSVAVLALIAVHPYALRLWVGADYIAKTGPLLVVLVSAHCLRNIGAPYAMMMLAVGAQKRALLSAILEGVANLVASIVLGAMWGAIGVAFGTLVGAIVGIAGSLLLNTRRTPELTPRPLAFALQTVVLPLAVFVPLQILLYFKLASLPT